MRDIEVGGAEPVAAPGAELLAEPIAEAGAGAETRAEMGAEMGAAQASTGAPVLSRMLTVSNRRGLHARAAAKFVTMAERFCASVDVVRDGQTVSARSIMGLMMLGAGRGAEVELRAEGWDAKEALEALAGLIEAGFDEQD